MANSKPVRVVRSAVTGRFVPPRQAVTRPRTTVVETIRKK